MAVGKAGCVEEACGDGDGFGFIWAVSLRLTRGVAVDGGTGPLWLPAWVRAIEADSRAGTGRPGTVTSDVTVVDESSPCRPKT